MLPHWQACIDRWTIQKHNASGPIYWKSIKMKTFFIVSITHTHPFNGPWSGIPRWAGTRKVKPIRILLKQETMSGSGISWAICKSAPRSRQITTPAPHHSVFYRPYALPATQPTVSKHWRQIVKALKSQVHAHIKNHRKLTEKSTFLNDCGWIKLTKLDMTRGACAISGSISTFRLGVNGSGSLMLRGNALSTRLRTWMQLGGMTSQKA